MISANTIIQDLKKVADKEKAIVYLRFFKTGKGEYGEGDNFIGVVVPKQKVIAKKYYKEIDYMELKKLILHSIHEVRNTAVHILNMKYLKAQDEEKKKIVDFYFENIKGFNNWDLIDISAPKILGEYFYKRRRDKIYEYADSKNLWKERVAVLTTFYFLRNDDFGDTLKFAKKFLTHKHDLIHKATGWMLREIGKRNKNVLEDFLKRYCKIMPRTMLRYAIEKFSKSARDKYLKGLI